MSLARALTKRYRAGGPEDIVAAMPSRAKSHRYGMSPIDRNQISLPTELISTTNVLAYTAPDLRDIVTNSSASLGSSASSTRSYEDSDRSPSFSSSSDASTAATSRETSPITSFAPSHLSTAYQSRTSVDSRRSNSSGDADAPAIPSRALSHTKKTHQILARKRSQSQIPPPQGTVLPPTSVRTSIDMFSGKGEVHPFGAELAQVNELAEEFGSKTAPRIYDEEEQFLIENGLQKFGAQDYMNEIQGLFGGVFDDRSFPMTAGWI